MNQNQKNEIRELLLKHIAQHPSQAKAATALKKVSEATLINIVKNKWDSISDDMWRNIGKQVGYSSKGQWTLVHTKDFKDLIELFDDAKEESNVYGIIAPEGSGKTVTAEYYSKNYPNAYHIRCADYFNKRVFLSKLLEAMGKDNSGNVSDMMDLIIDTARRQEDPIIILDEFDKLPDAVIYFFITLYNMLYGKCAIVMLGTDYLAKRITMGSKKRKKGYGEILSRIGRRFITLRGTDKNEIAAICEANGVTDPMLQNRIFNEYEGDLRRVDRAVHKARKTSEKQPA